MPALVLKALSDNVEEWRRELLKLMPELEVRVWPDVGNTEDVDIAFMARMPQGELTRYPNLKGFINLHLGVEMTVLDPTIPKGLPIARTVDSAIPGVMTAYILYGVIRFHRNFDVFESFQRRKHWEFIRGKSNSASRVGIMGLGVIGDHAARVLRDQGFRVFGWSRTPKSIDDVTCFHGLDQLQAFLGQTDILCCILPMTRETRGILNRQTLSQLPRGASLINVARGGVVNEEDLLALLDENHIRGAMLDVFKDEPLTTNSPFWDHPKVIVTPHTAGSTNPATAAPQVVENIRRIRAGLPLLNAVNMDIGY